MTPVTRRVSSCTVEVSPVAGRPRPCRLKGVRKLALTVFLIVASLATGAGAELLLLRLTRKSKPILVPRESVAVQPVAPMQARPVMTSPHFGYPFLPPGMERQTIFYRSPDGNIQVTQKYCPTVADIPDDTCAIIAGVPQCAPGAVETDDLDIICQQKTSLRLCTFSPSFKKKMAKRYGVEPGTRVEIANRVPLTLGGSNAVENLWPEASDFRETDRVEQLHRDVCAGTISLEAARNVVLNSGKPIAADAPPRKSMQAGLGR